MRKHTNTMVNVTPRPRFQQPVAVGTHIGGKGATSNPAETVALLNPTVTTQGPISLPDNSDSVIMKFLAESVTEGTRANYKPHKLLWLEYHKEFLAGSTDYVLKSVDSDEAKAKVWVLFIVYLYTMHGLREEEVYAVLAGVRHYIITSLGSVSFLTLETVKKARQSCCRTTEEQRTHAIKSGENKILPLCWEVLDTLREKYWSEQSWNDWDGMFYKTVFLCVSLGLNIGARISNLTLKEGKHENHCVRADSLFFVVVSNGTDDEIPASSVAARSLTYEQVTSMVVHVYTTKTGESIGDAIPKSISRDSSESSQLINDVLDFVHHTRLTDNDELFTIYRSESMKPGYKPKMARKNQSVEPRIFRKVIRRRDVASAIKVSCKANDLPEKHFSTSSIRKTFATRCALKGVPEEMTNKIANWKPDARSKKSRTKAKHYDHSPVISRGLASKEITLDDVRRMIPARRRQTREADSSGM